MYLSCNDNIRFFFISLPYLYIHNVRVYIPVHVLHEYLLTKVQELNLLKGNPYKSTTGVTLVDVSNGKAGDIDILGLHGNFGRYDSGI